jgi:hypothetical protein
VTGEGRCPWAIQFGLTLHTRCDRDAGHQGAHEGPGLARFPYQRVQWYPGDRREYEEHERLDTSAWEAA